MLQLVLFASASAPAGAMRLTASGRSLQLAPDNSGQSTPVGPWLMRGISYSPLPWGFDTDIFQRTRIYEESYLPLFVRDLDIIKAMGANAVRIPGYMGLAADGGRHTDFLDAAHARGINVLVSYEMSAYGQNAIRLASAAERTDAQARFSYFVRAVRHKAIVLVLLGTAMNRGDTGYVCPDNGGAIPGCDFGDNVNRFAEALQSLCDIAHEDGDMACTVPLINMPLPGQNGGGIADWLRIMGALQAWPTVDSPATVGRAAAHAWRFALADHPACTPHTPP